MEIKIIGKEITLARLTLKGWSELEEIKKSIDNTASIKKDFNNHFTSLVRFIEATIISEGHGIDWLQVPWFDFLEVFSYAVHLNTPTIAFPIFRGNRDPKQKKLPWEYDGRSWYFWLNLFASNYGWTEEIIAELDIDTAFGLYQELEIDEQLRREFQWGMSERSLSYDSTTKKSKFVPMPRPNWMMPIIPKQLPIIKIRRDHLPVGNIRDLQAEEENRKKSKSGI